MIHVFEVIDVDMMLPFFAFFAHDSGIRAMWPPKNMLVAMTISAALCIGIGVAPGAFYSLLPYESTYVPYTVSHCLTQVQLLAFAALAVVVLIRTGVYPPEVRATNVDAEWTYRKLGPMVCSSVGGAALSVYQFVCAIGLALVDVVIALARHFHDPRGVLSRSAPIGLSALFAAVMLVVFLVLYYF